MIDRCFAFDMMDEIVSALDADGSGFAAETKEVLLTKAPSSLVLTLCLLRLGRAAPTLEACLEREFHAPSRCWKRAISARVSARW